MENSFLYFDHARKFDIILGKKMRVREIEKGFILSLFNGEGRRTNLKISDKQKRKNKKTVRYFAFSHCLGPIIGAGPSCMYAPYRFLWISYLIVRSEYSQFAANFCPIL